jgi:hypothetical protein
MSLVTMLLCVIVFLLLVIFVMLTTLWPRRLRDEMDRLGNGLRREIAEQRSDNLKIMKSLRIVVEDAVKESVEKELASAPPRSRSRKSARAKALEAETVPEAVAAEEAQDNGAQLTVLQAMQIPLFPEKSEAAQPAPEPETIHMGFVDDIPEIGE